MTYFLEKNFNLNYDGQIVPFSYGHLIVRPCLWDYEDALSFFTGKLKPTKDLMLRLEPQISIFGERNYANKDAPVHKTPEE